MIRAEVANTCLGGNEEDFELVKDTKYSGTGSGNEPTLAGDLRQFVKGLGLKQPVNAKSSLKTAGMPSALDKVSKHKKSPKSLEAPTKKTHSSPEELAISSATGAIKKIEPVKLPSKVSLKRDRAVPSGSMTPAQLSILTSRAEDLHNKDTITYQTSSSSTSEASFLTKIISSGTLSDRLSALTLLVQSSPLHNAKSLDTLKSMAERGKGKGGREESLKALRCIVDWWVGGEHQIANSSTKIMSTNPVYLSMTF
ncbi:CBF/Mak21 family-domain-containing protein [Salix suchowensis]|nr:CBF/Mak21 family-domain-containing protein [Salix suchowensis]